MSPRSANSWPGSEPTPTPIRNCTTCAGPAGGNGGREHGHRPVPDPHRGPDPARQAVPGRPGAAGPHHRGPAPGRDQHTGWPGHRRAHGVAMTRLRIRRSTLALCAFFLLTLAVYLLVPPDTVAQV